MSSIRKYTQSGSTKEWLKMAETNVLPDELSSANNISVDFGSKPSVNSLLYEHEQEIEKLKRNVSWLALHGGGGSGGGGGGGSTARKASCQILVNYTSREVSVTEGQNIKVTLQEFKGTVDTTPWKIQIAFDGTQIVNTSKTPVGGSITIPIQWSLVEKFFAGTGKTKNHTIRVTASYSDATTQIDGNVAFETFVYIPTIECAFKPKDSYDVTGSTAMFTADLVIETALTGSFVLQLDSAAYGITLPPYEYPLDKQQTTSTFTLNLEEAFKSGGEIKTGIFNTQASLYFLNTSSGQEIKQLVYTTIKQIVVYNSAVDMFVNFNGISPTRREPTEIYDNVKNIFFSFYAFKNGSTEFEYSVELEDLTEDQPEKISVVESAQGAFGVQISVNKILGDSFETNHTYRLNFKITPTKPSRGDQKIFYGYVKCVQGQYSFIRYTDDGETTRLFALDPFNAVFNRSGIVPEMQITSTNTNPIYIGSTITADVEFGSINPRSGLINDDQNVKALRLYDTYMNIKNGFKYTARQDGHDVRGSIDIGSCKEFSICICYKAQKYPTNDHVIFSLCNNGYLDQGISIKNDGIYLKDQKELAVLAEKITTINIIYDNRSGDNSSKWGSKSCLKIYVDGVITYMTDKCPFGQDSNGNIKNDNLRISLNGTTTASSRLREYQCNCDIYDVEILQKIQNEIDILASYINNQIRTHYVDKSPDFTIITKELDKNCCSYDNNEHTISSMIYPVVGPSRKFQFKGILLDSNGEVPSSSDPEEIEAWTERLSSLSLPVAYIDMKGSDPNWTFENFLGQSLVDMKVTSKFYYWDPTTRQMPISSDSVAVSLQGTSTLGDKIKNLQIKFNSRDESGKVVQDLFFVNQNLVPENQYILKADVVDSSHANNASIGRFINDNFKEGNTFGFGFDSKGVAARNIAQTKTVLQDQQGWTIEPTLKHTVEGFQILLLVRFYDSDFINLGIYSFNIGRNAARNLGFEFLNSITDINGQAISSVVAPMILKDVIVNTNSDTNIFWVENSDSENFSALSSWTNSTQQITPDPGNVNKRNPNYECRFWHCQQGEDDTKLNQLFEVKYYNTPDSRPPSQIGLFKTFVEQVSKLPIEGLLKTDAMNQSFPQIGGSYITWKYKDETWSELDTHHQLATSIEDANINSFSVEMLASYYVMTLLFGLVDNLDKNISFRVFGEDNKLLADFYDMDTALGLNNVGLEDVTPTVGPKLVVNYENLEGQNYPEETYDTTKVKDMYPNYQKYLPETYSNKLWMSLDTNSMRELKSINYSLYTSLWFKLRAYLDNIAKENDCKDFVEYFTSKYFETQVKCGTLLYNYDYMMKYLNDYEQTGEKQSDNTISKLHGRRIDEVKTWLRQHIDFLDSYFYWRGGYTYVEGSTVVPKGLESVVTKLIAITTSSNNSSIDIETEHPAIVHSSSTADNGKVGDTLTIDNLPQRIKVSAGGTDKAMWLNCPEIIKNLDLISMGAKRFRSQDGSKITFLEELILDGLTIVADGISLKDFIDDSSTEINAISKISMNQTKFAQAFDLDLRDYQFLNVSYVDIENSTNVRSLQFYKGDGDDKTTQNLKVLKVNGSQIENLELRNQTYLPLPKVNDCKNLFSLKVYNCNLDNIDSSTRSDLSNYMNLNLSVQTSIEEVVFDTVEQLSTVSINKCPSLETVTLRNISALTTVKLNNNTNLNNIDIYNCPKLTSIQITECQNFEELTLDEVNNLQELNLRYDTKLSRINVSENSVKKIKKINLQNVDIHGFNYGGNDIIKDPDGNEVLDFQPFDSLESTGLTIQGDSSGDYTADKCANFKAIRFPNKPGRSYRYISDQDRNSFSRLQYLYGHINLTSLDWYGSCNNPQKGMFLKVNSTYKGYPAFLGTITEKSDLAGVKSVLLGNTVFDQFIKYDTSPTSPFNGIRDGSVSVLDSLESAYTTSTDSGFLKVTTSKGELKEFDKRDSNPKNDWATNYTVQSLGSMWRSKYINELEFQYLVYRVSVYNRAKQKSGEALDFNYAFTYAPTGWESKMTSGIDIPSNTYRFIGRTFRTLTRMFWVSPSKNNQTAPYNIIQGLMKWMPNLTQYNSFSMKDKLACDALATNRNIKTLGTTDTTNGIGVSETIEEDTNHMFFNNLTALETLTWFRPNNLDLQGYQLPSSVKTVANSFTNQPPEQILDFKKMFSSQTLTSNTNLTAIYGSFSDASMVLKPSTFKVMPNIQQLDLLSTNYKYIVEDSIELSDCWNEEAGGYVVPYDYTSQMYTEFLSSIICSNGNLKSLQFLLSNSGIPYKNFFEPDGEPELLLSKDMFKNNTQLTAIAYLMWSVNYRYGLVGDMFNGLTNLQNINYIFGNDSPSLSRGISSEIPYHLFYQGSKIEDRTFIGTDRFDSVIDSYSTLKTNLPKTYTPANTKIEGQTSLEFDDLSARLNSIGLLNSVAFNSIKGRITGQYVNLPTQLEDIRPYCPLVTMEKDENDNLVSVVTTGGEKAVHTLSSLNKIFQTESNWDTFTGKSSKNLSLGVYTANIKTADGAFQCNPLIRSYTGETKTEHNELYSPWKLIYNSSSKSFTYNEDRNTFQNDDSWSHNGNIWRSTEDGYELVNYNPDNYNVVSPEMYVLTCDSSTQTTFYKLDGTEETIVGGIVSNRTYDTSSGRKLWFEYWMPFDFATRFNYICSPDVFRYFSKDMTYLKNVFYHCDNFNNGSSFGISPSTMNWGLAGRIPPNLLNKLPNLNTITQMFEGCYHITGYAKEDESGDLKSYIIPEEFFAKADQVHTFSSAFSRILIPYEVDLKTPLSKISPGSIKAGINLNIYNIFGRCIWYKSGQINGLLAGKYFSNINDAFYCKWDNRYWVGITTYGAKIGTHPFFYVFTQTKYVPTTIQNTYLGFSIGSTSGVSIKDVARSTTTDGQHKPVEPGS